LRRYRSHSRFRARVAVAYLMAALGIRGVAVRGSSRAAVSLADLGRAAARGRGFRGGVPRRLYRRDHRRIFHPSRAAVARHVSQTERRARRPVGVLRGGIIILIVFLVAGITSLPQRPWWRESLLAPYFQKVAVVVSAYIPRDIARHIRFS